MVGKHFSCSCIVCMSTYSEQVAPAKGSAQSHTPVSGSQARLGSFQRLESPPHAPQAANTHRALLLLFNIHIPESRQRGKPIELVIVLAQR